MTFYQVRFNIDRVVEADEDNDIAIGQLIGAPTPVAYRNVDRLRQYGWDVTKVTTPDEDAPGTMRRFELSGDRAVKVTSGDWWYIGDSVKYGKVTDLDMRICTSEVVS